MNILILGSGGREHALVWKLAQSNKIARIFIAPGNAGTSVYGTNLEINPEDFVAVKRTVIENKIGIVLVGPEAPLVAGIYDFFVNDPDLRSVPVIGPSKSAAMLEGSKDFAKSFLIRHKIPTAAYKTFDRSNINDARQFLESLTPPYVIKADGLAAGKGVVILDDVESSMAEIYSMLEGKFGAAGNKVVIEQFLKGVELSAFIITDGKSYKILPEAKDYKRIGAGDTGLNTGGMGAVSPVPFADEVFRKKIIERIIEPTVSGLSEDGILYKGFIFFGLIKVEGDPYVIEYNARLGDPESEVIIPRIKSDLFDLISGVADGNLAEKELEIDSRFVTAVMIASGGYPGHYDKGKVISGLDSTEGCVVFHAGTKTTDNKILTSGGRVVAISSWGETLEEALDRSYSNAGRIYFENMYFRPDIGFDLKQK